MQPTHAPLDGAQDDPRTPEPRHGNLSHERLNDMAAAIGRRGRIGFGDVRRLERDILPHGVTCREEAEILIRLDRVASRADRAWNEWFVAVMVDYVVWSERPPRSSTRRRHCGCPWPSRSRFRRAMLDAWYARSCPKLNGSTNA